VPEPEATHAQGMSLVIIGAGLAGAKAAEAARATGYDGVLVLVGEEPAPPYERPPLSKQVLRGEKEPESTAVFGPTFYADHEIDLLVDEAVTSLDVASRKLALSSGHTLGYDVAVLATGAAPRRLDLPGSQLTGVHYLRTRGDSVALSSAIRGASRVAVIGAGWIGSEVAASARQMGADVVMVEPAELPLLRVLGSDVAGAFRDLHTDQGATLRFGLTPTGFAGSSAVEGVELDDGTVEAADLVVVGVGAGPRVELAEAAGLEVKDGVVVDQHLRAGATGILAAGDVASAWHPRFERHLRIEHWANALNQGAAAGHNAVGSPEPYTRLPYFYSDQYDLGLEYVGWADASTSEVAIRGSLATREFIAFYHQGGVVNAALAVNTWDVIEDLKTIVAANAPADLARLTDLDAPLV
jgi:3-phenylpropionate/trans-cinnamate dioxygenase ferredoxin reductase subunit